MKTKWSVEMEEKLTKLYPNTLTQKIADILQLPLSTVRNKAHSLSLKKDKKWISENSRKNMKSNEGAKKSAFKKGRIPENKGKRQSDYLSADKLEQVKKSQFKKGQKPHNAKPDFYEAIRKDSKGNPYWMIKLPEEKRMIHKHIWIWQNSHGKIQNGFVVVFKDKNPMNCVIENLECIPREELMLRNSHRCDYPNELIPEYLKISKLNKLIKEKLCQN